jgi:8-oxo-dGTP pyrophosphatase MutT (NUDIX family)
MSTLKWPIFTAESVFQGVRDLGIMSWPRLSDPVAITEYLRDASSDQLKTYERFAPKSSVVYHKNPHNGTTFDGFKVDFKPYACVFALIDGMVPVTAEWKHGNDRITLVPVCGVPGKTEDSFTTLTEKMYAVGLREWEEETGTKLKNLVPLSGPEGIYSTVRNCKVQCFPFLGEVEDNVVQGPTKFDDTEHLKMVLIPLPEWIQLITSVELWAQNPDFGLEACTRDVTWAALHKMGRLQLV